MTVRVNMRSKGYISSEKKKAMPTRAFFIFLSLILLIGADMVPILRLNTSRSSPSAMPKCLAQNCSLNNHILMLNQTQKKRMAKNVALQKRKQFKLARTSSLVSSSDTLQFYDKL